jgi:hypothetical protein
VSYEGKEIRCKASAEARIDLQEKRLASQAPMSTISAEGAQIETVENVGEMLARDWRHSQKRRNVVKTDRNAGKVLFTLASSTDSCPLGEGKLWRLK